jgi:hypothetical protein
MFKYASFFNPKKRSKNGRRKDPEKESQWGIAEQDQ